MFFTYYLASRNTFQGNKHVLSMNFLNQDSVNKFCKTYLCKKQTPELFFQDLDKQIFELFADSKCNF